MATPQGYKTIHMKTAPTGGKHCMRCVFSKTYLCHFPKHTGKECDFDHAIIYKKISIKEILSKL